MEVDPRRANSEEGGSRAERRLVSNRGEVTLTASSSSLPLRGRKKVPIVGGSSGALSDEEISTEKSNRLGRKERGDRALSHNHQRIR